MSLVSVREDGEMLRVLVLGYCWHGGLGGQNKGLRGVQYSVER